MNIVTAAEMQAMDAWTIDQYGIPGRILMENAGRGAVTVFRTTFGDPAGRRVGIAAGKGNNGGDGFVMARYLCQQGARVSLFLMTESKSLRPGDARDNFRLLDNLDITVVDIVDEASLAACRSAMAHQELWVDALLGTGLTSDVRGLYKAMINRINHSRKPVLAVDVPSGLNADTGQPCGACIQAQATATFGFAKIGHVVYPGLSRCGEVTVVDIGIPNAAAVRLPVTCSLMTADRYVADYHPREADCHKGSNGHLLVIGASPGKTGAAAMAANAAMRAGTGLVTLGCPWSLNPILESQVLEAMTCPLPETADGVLDAAAADRVLALSEGKQCIAVGPGIGTAPETRHFVHRLVRESRIPLVIDADGINCIAGDTGVLAHAAVPVILTPHPGEMARLIGTETVAVQIDRVATARRFATETGTHVVLKGARTISGHPDGRVVINPSGNPGMASGGVGDVLTGIVAGFVAQGYSPQAACRMGVYLHGAAGDYVAGIHGRTGFLASDIITALPGANDVIGSAGDLETVWPLTGLGPAAVRLWKKEK